MTIDEKVDILSCDFRQLWYRVWLGPQANGFPMARMKFCDKLVKDGGGRLKSLIRRSQKYGARVWEIPKGHKKFADEHEIDCAIREFYEETGIPRSAYCLTAGEYTLCFTEGSVTYEIRYFIAITARDVIQRLNSSALEQVAEICDIRWVSASELDTFIARDVRGHRRIIHFAKKLLRNPFVVPVS
jgi:8-oxo-dGTP pyrophosphatase MutT (NUDIX family)